MSKNRPGGFDSGRPLGFFISPFDFIMIAKQVNAMKNTPLLLRTILTTFCLSCLWGCAGSEQLPTAPASGKVTYKGESVKGGSLTFAPVPSEDGKPAGKPASATVNEDGTFKLTTYVPDDGAVVGKHTVNYTPPSDGGGEDSAEGHAEQKKSPYEGLKPKTPEVEIKEGVNDLTIELQ
jgi:hypothetical protein